MIAGEVEVDDLYEVVDGKRIQLSNSPYGAWLVSLLAGPLGNFVCARRLGWTTCHALFHCPAPINRDRRPDVAFVSYDRWPKTKPLPSTDPWNVVPNLATEVVSPNDKVDEMEQKIAEYFRAGVELVWVVHPTLSKIHVYSSPTQPIVILNVGDVLEGGTVVPGFRLPLAELFTETTDASAVNDAG
jgi:Uma2 family endonuclease